MTNIKQTDLLEYLVQAFNTNNFDIPFRMGTYGADKTGLTIYAPARDNHGRFDQIDTFDEDTYQTGKSSFVVMNGLANSGEYTPLPNVQMVSYDVSVDFLVYVDSPISEFIRMAIEEVRDNLVGNLDVLEVTEMDLENDDTINTDYLRLATTADSIDFGQIITVKKRNYMVYTLTISMTVSKNVEMGNQVKWEFLKVLRESECVEPTVDIFDYEINDEVTADDYSIWKVVSVESGGRQWEFVSVPTEALEVIPLIFSWGTTQDQESFQNLRPYETTTTLSDRAKEVHNYVKSRGFGTAFTFLANFDSYIIKHLYMETFQKETQPRVYEITMKTQTLNDSGKFEDDSDLTFTRSMIFGEAQVGDCSYGDPIVFAIGFTPSAKDE